MDRDNTIVVKLSGRFFGDPQEPWKVNPLLMFVVMTLEGWVRDSQKRCVVVVVGGGNVIRGRDIPKEFANEMGFRRVVDLMGMLSSRVNGEILYQLFLGTGLMTEHLTSQYGSPDLATQLFTPSKLEVAVDNNNFVVLSSGVEPGVSTDTRAVEIALALGSCLLLKLTTDILGLHEIDPRVNSTAKLLREASYADLANLGAGVVFDSGAIAQAEKGGVKIRILNPPPSKCVKNKLQEALRDHTHFIGTTVG